MLPGLCTSGQGTQGPPRVDPSLGAPASGPAPQDSPPLVPQPSSGRAEEEVCPPEILEEPAPANVPCRHSLLAQSGHFLAPEK